jgi:hypothetical protein
MVARIRQLWTELKRRNVARVVAVYVVVAVPALATFQAFAEGFQVPWAFPLAFALVATGLPLAAVLAWAYELTPDLGPAGASNTPVAQDTAGIGSAGTEALDRQIATRLAAIDSRATRLNRIVDRWSDGVELSTTELKDLLSEVLKRIPGIVEVEAADGSDTSTFTWLRHDLDTSLFRAIKPRVLVAGVCRVQASTSSGLRTLFGEARVRVDEAGLLSNAFLCVADGPYSDDARDAVRTLLGDQLHTTLARVGDVVELADAVDRVRALEALLTRA